MITVLYGPGDIVNFANNFSNDYCPVVFYPFSTLHPEEMKVELDKYIACNPHAVIVTNNRDILITLMYSKGLKVRFIKVLKDKFPGTNDYWKQIKLESLKFLVEHRREFR